MKKVFFAFFLLCNVSLFAGEGVYFKFKQNKGDSSVHTSTVDEEAYLNGYLNNRVQFINRTSTTITDILENGDARLHTDYMTTENHLFTSTGRHLSWGEEDSVNINRTSQGQLYNSDNRFLPTVQSVPSFPEKAVLPGESWKMKGKEVHDCRQLFNMTTAIEIPFTASYTYMGIEEVDGQEFDIISVYYEFYQENPFNKRDIDCTYAGASGFAKQKIYWDRNQGDINHYTEEFQIKMIDIYRNTYLFKSIAHGEVIEYKSINDDDTLQQIKDTVDELQLENISVKKDDKGLTISLENIQFEADSDILLESEMIKLQKIGEILSKFSNDLLITGHCAERGSVKARQILSEDRAESVAAYLQKLGIRDEKHIFTQGKGSTEPIASNSTEEGRKKNRRVEITLVN